MPAQVDICNRALSVIGTRSSIASMTEANPEAEACTTHFEAATRALLRLAPWSFARYQANLALIAAAGNTPENPNNTPPFPPVPWTYEYAWPQDCVRLRQVKPPYYPPGETPENSGLVLMPGFYQAPMNMPFGFNNRPSYQIGLDYDANGNQIKVIMSYIEDAIIIYTALVDNPNLWDDEFSEAMVFMLASHLVGALIGDKQMDKALYEKAAQAAIVARAVDGNEQPVSPSHTPDWIKVRGYYPIPGDLPYPTDDDFGDSGGWGNWIW
ncbi:MAG: hypothetical protein ABSF52_09365 [Syntrophobacteraceae bacterium]